VPRRAFPHRSLLAGVCSCCDFLSSPFKEALAVPPPSRPFAVFVSVNSLRAPWGGWLPAWLSACPCLPAWVARCCLSVHPQAIARWQKKKARGHWAVGWPEEVGGTPRPSLPAARPPPRGPGPGAGPAGRSGPGAGQGGRCGWEGLGHRSSSRLCWPGPWAGRPGGVTRQRPAVSWSSRSPLWAVLLNIWE